MARIFIRHYSLFWRLSPAASGGETLGASKRSALLAFEEGYLRPHFITLESGGVNAYSSIPRDPEFYRHLPDRPELEVHSLKPSTRLRIWHAIWYYLVSWYHEDEFSYYRHHKSLFSLV